MGPGASFRNPTKTTPTLPPAAARIHTPAPAAAPVRPRVLLNCAATLDGRIAGPDGGPMRVSDDEDLRRVHRMRADCDAVLVGVGTVLSDDPSLRVKPEYATGPDPLRVVLDTRLRTPRGARVVDGTAPTLVFHAPDATSGLPAGMTDAVRRGPGGGLDLAAVLAVLRDGGVESVMVEGGARVLASFLRTGLWDRWTLYQAPWVAGTGPGLPPFPAGTVRTAAAQPLGDGVLWTLEPGGAVSR